MCECKKMTNMRYAAERDWKTGWQKNRAEPKISFKDLSQV